MKKYFATYNQSLALKELGFKEPCFGWYEHNSNFYYCYQEGIVPPTPSKKLIKGCCLAPLKSQVFDWFRKYKLSVVIHDLRDDYEANIIEWTLDDDKISYEFLQLFETYEEAESACIDKLIELLQHDK